MSCRSNPYYQAICSEMTWSYSRLKSFEQCRYGFLLKYILLESTRRCFYSSYGSFLHHIYEQYYSGKLSKFQLKPYYLSHFAERVEGQPPGESVLSSYFQKGRDSFDRLPEPDGDILGVEFRSNFRFGGYRFTGIADLVTKDSDGITIWDHKSHDLKPRSTKGRYLKSDEELDQYLRQLYLYAAPVEKKFGEKPIRLRFHCYRSGTLITEPYRQRAADEAVQWATDLADAVIHCDDWYPNLDFYYCKHLCDVQGSCEYYELQYKH